MIVFVAIAVMLAIFLSRNFMGGNNLDERKAYWGKEIAASVPAGTRKAQLDAFASARGEKLNCYQTYSKEDQCDLDDNKSLGGPSNLRMKLSVIFKMKDEKIVSHSFTNVPASQSK